MILEDKISLRKSGNGNNKKGTIFLSNYKYWEVLWTGQDYSLLWINQDQKLLYKLFELWLKIRLFLERIGL